MSVEGGQPVAHRHSYTIVDLERMHQSSTQWGSLSFDAVNFFLPLNFVVHEFLEYSDMRASYHVSIYDAEKISSLC